METWIFIMFSINISLVGIIIIASLWYFFRVDLNVLLDWLLGLILFTSCYRNLYFNNLFFHTSQLSELSSRFIASMKYTILRNLNVTLIASVFLKSIHLLCFLLNTDFCIIFFYSQKSGREWVLRRSGFNVLLLEKWLKIKGWFWYK